MEFTLNLNHNNIAVLHCDNGIQRTKLFAACFCCSVGCTIDEALLLFYRKRLRKPTYDVGHHKNMSSSAASRVNSPKTLLYLHSSSILIFLNMSIPL